MEEHVHHPEEVGERTLLDAKQVLVESPHLLHRSDAGAEVFQGFDQKPSGTASRIEYHLTGLGGYLLHHEANDRPGRVEIP